VPIDMAIFRRLVPLHNGYDSLAEGNLALIGSG
jgi:hypothetical protein